MVNLANMKIMADYEGMGKIFDEALSAFRRATWRIQWQGIEDWKGEIRLFSM